MIPLNKKQLPALALLPCLGHQALALGVGAADVQSRLGAPLQAEIPLTDWQGQQLMAQLADDSAYQRLGIEAHPGQRQLQFKTVLDDGTPRIVISTREHVVEPYVSFVLSLQWPDGSLVHHYSVLIDPQPASSHASTDLINNSAGKRQLRSSVRTHSGDSLWRLARRLDRPQGSNIAQVMNAVYRGNPHAFVAGNPAKLKPDADITVPNSKQIQAASRSFNSPAASDQSGAAKATAGVEATSPRQLDSQQGLSTAVPGKPRQSAATDGELDDQLAGLKAGIAAAEAGKARTKTHIAVLEQELNALTERYRALAEKTRNVEQQLTGGQNSVDGDVSATTTPAQPKLTPLFQFGSIMVGFAFAGYILGRILRPSRKTPAKTQASSRKTGLFKRQQVAGSATYEQPYDRSNAPGSLTTEAPAANDTPTNSPAIDAPEMEGLTPREEPGEDTGLVAAGYIAFGMHDEAETLLSEAIIAQPERLDLKLQLLELYSKTANVSMFEGLAEAIEEQSEDDSVGTRIELLRLQIAANDSLDDQTRNQNAS